MKAKRSLFERPRTGWLFLEEVMFLLELRVLAFEGLQLRDLAGRSRWRCLRDCPLGGDPSFASLPPLREHEGMDLQRRGDGLHLNPGLLTQANSGELQLVAVAERLCVVQRVAQHLLVVR